MQSNAEATDGTVRILHIEDDTRIAHLVATVIKDKTIGRYDVAHAATQAKGIAYARRHPVDIVLTDLGLPDSRGIDGLRNLVDTLPTIPIVVLSAEDDPVVRRRAYALGVAAFLDKADMGSTALDACLHAALLKGHAEQGRQSVADDRNDDLDHKDTITILTRVLHLHHAETVRHACRVAEIAHAIAIKMGLDPAHAESVRTAGLLHDIGKIMVSREGILDSRAPLTETDWQCIKEHPQAGYDVLSTVEWPSPIPDIVFQHHERMDGTGYPAGRRGDAILLEARILAVADALDARAHRQDQTAECGIAVALAHLRDNSGTLYDAAVVKTCCEIFEDPAASPSAPRADSGARPCTTVLVIDDEPAMGRSIERSLLGLNGVVVSVAADGASGLDIARRTTPGMILLDIRMPGMDGMDVLRELQTEPETESIPVVMLTAVDDRETMRAALVAGVEDYLTKPVPPDWLREVVARRLSPQQHR